MMRAIAGMEAAWRGSWTILFNLLVNRLHSSKSNTEPLVANYNDDV